MTTILKWVDFWNELIIECIPCKIHGYKVEKGYFYILHQTITHIA